MGANFLIITNGEHLKLFNVKNRRLEKMLVELKFEDISKHHERQRLKNSRYLSKGNQAHFFDPHSVPEDLDRNDFLKHAVDKVSPIIQGEKKHNVILCADPKTLGAFRALKHNPIKEWVIKEVNKDLTSTAENKVEDIVFD